MIHSAQDFVATHELINIKLENLVQRKVMENFSLFAFSNIDTCELTLWINKVAKQYPEIVLTKTSPFVTLKYSHSLLHMLQKEILKNFMSRDYEKAKITFYGKYQEVSQELIEAMKNCDDLVKEIKNVESKG